MFISKGEEWYNDKYLHCAEMISIRHWGRWDPCARREGERAGPADTWQAHRPCDFRPRDFRGGRQRQSQEPAPPPSSTRKWTLKAYLPFTTTRGFQRKRPLLSPSQLLQRDPTIIIVSKWVRRKLGQEPKSITTTRRVPPGRQKAWTPVNLWFRVLPRGQVPTSPQLLGCHSSGTLGAAQGGAST